LGVGGGGEVEGSGADVGGFGCGRWEREVVGGVDGEVFAVPAVAPVVVVLMLSVLG